MKTLLRQLAVIGILAGAIWFAGFLWFIAQVSSLNPPPAPKADGIVVLTGGSGRVAEGLKLLQAGAAKKLLISGVHRDVALPELLATAAPELDAPMAPEMAACCITLGYMAPTTDGNAVEADAWTRNEKFHSLIVVTAQYHLPRALLDFHRALPGVELVPYPLVRPAVDPAQWWESYATARLLMVEYTKYGGALLRAAATLLRSLLHV